jgi:hypothetical protein
MYHRHGNKPRFGDDPRTAMDAAATATRNGDDINRFDPRHSYLIGVMRRGHSPETPDSEVQRTGKLRAKKLHGSQLIEHGVYALDELFRDNPFGLIEGQTYDVFEFNADTESRRYMGGGTVLPKPKPIVPEPAATASPSPSLSVASPTMASPTMASSTMAAPRGISDDEEYSYADTRGDNRWVIPLFESDGRNERRDDSMQRINRQKVYDELSMTNAAVSHAQGIAEQTLMQNERVLEQLQSTLDTLRETARDRDQTTRELAAVKAQVDAIIQIREFEERVRSEREAERQAWKERERELERSLADEANSRGGLADSFLENPEAWVRVLTLVLNLIRPSGPPPGMPGGIPGGMPGVPPGAMMPPNGMPPNGMQMNGMPQRMPAYTSSVPQAAAAQPQRNDANASTSENASSTPNGTSNVKVF